MVKMDKLEKALSNFLETEDARNMALLLSAAMKSGILSYDEAKTALSEEPEDILILGYGWRLIVPVRATKSGDWEDRMLIPQSGEKYQMPNVVRHLVENASKTGSWEQEKAIFDVFRSIGEPDLDKMPILVERIASERKGHRVYGVRIKKICRELGLVERVDALVSELKACGILSHKLSSTTDVARAGSPIYEFNPSLLVGEATN